MRGQALYLLAMVKDWYARRVRREHVADLAALGGCGLEKRSGCYIWGSAAMSSVARHIHQRAPRVELGEGRGDAAH